MRLDINLGNQNSTKIRGSSGCAVNDFAGYVDADPGLTSFYAMNWLAARRDDAIIATYRAQIARIDLVNKRNSFSPPRKSHHATNANF